MLEPSTAALSRFHSAVSVGQGAAFRPPTAQARKRAREWTRALKLGGRRSAGEPISALMKYPAFERIVGGDISQLAIETGESRSGSTGLGQRLRARFQDRYACTSPELGGVGCNVSISRRPDSNRGPLHYEPWDRGGVCRRASVERSD